MSKKDAAEFGEITFLNKDTKFLLSDLRQGVKLIFFSDSHLAPKFFKVAANSKKLFPIFKDKQDLFLHCHCSR